MNPAMAIKTVIKSLLPHGIFLYLKRSQEKVWQGQFSKWEEAASQCSGYDQQSILNLATQATAAVVQGKARWERDTVLFQEASYSSGLLAALNLSGAFSSSSFAVADFGGALGSLYHQHRDILKNISHLNWTVVEQPHFVKTGQTQFTTSQLSFAHSLDEISDVNLLIYSSVLQYLPDPWLHIRQIRRRAPWIYIDRTAFTRQGQSMIKIQTVPKEIYEASYPCWFFNEEQFKAAFAADYELVSDFPALDSANDPELYFKGFIFRRRSLS